MKAFLKKVADHIYLNHKDHLEDLSVVVPNRRAGLFLGKYLSSKSETPIWSPQFYSIEDFVFKLSGFQLVPLLDLIFELYAVHVEIEGPNKQSFDRFNGWGQLLLKDFNDLDLYLKDADEIFHYLSEAKAISIWQLDPNKMTNLERDYLKFYASLGDYYKKLNQRLKEKNLAYQGMAYRHLATSLHKLPADNKPILFAGFNALSPSEDVIFDFFEKRGNAKVLWDIDQYYFNDTQQEAGAFLRKQLGDIESKNIQWIENRLETDEKNVNVFGLSGNVSMAKMAGNILQDLAQNKENIGEKLSDETAVVLADEQLITPVLYSLPNDIDTFNITMSYPSKLSRVYELVVHLFDLYIPLWSANGTPVKSPRFYHKNLESLLLHPIVQQYFYEVSTANNSQYIIDEIRKSNISFINQNDFPKEFEFKKNDKSVEFLSLLSQSVKKPEDLLEIIGNVIDALFQGGKQNESSVMDQDFLYYYLNLITRMRDLINTYPYINQISTLKKLFISLASAQGIPFTGEPLTGVQIMGMLETRTLDFENLILLSANEGMLPKSHVYQSFILPDIKRELGLPLPVDNDSIFAYHFYRLMQRAKNIYILYNTQNGGMGEGELSRYVQQLSWEWSNKNPNVKWSHKLFHIPLMMEEYDRQIKFPKDKFAIGRLKTICEKGLSPSALNTYKSCSLKFYFQRVLEMYSEDEVEETLAANTQGTVIHGVLDAFYKSVINKILSKEFLDDMADGFPAVLEGLFLLEYKKGELKRGKNLLLHEVAKRYIEYFIQKEVELVEKGTPCTILVLEDEHKRSLNMDLGGESINVNFKGKADRIDRLGDTIRVIDYKTGFLKDTDLYLYSRKVDIWDQMFSAEKEKAFQLMMYAWLYNPKSDATLKLETGIIGLKYHSVYKPLFLSKDEKNIDQEHMDRFEVDLRQLVEDIFDPSVEFTQCEDIKTCGFCDYKFICGRWEE